MPTAKVQLPNGASVTIEADSSELVRITQMLTGSFPAPAEKVQSRTRVQKLKPKSSKPKGLTDHVRALKEEGFFKAGKTLDEVREALKAAGYIHGPNQISPVLLRMRRGGEIGRIKKDDVWTYTHRD